MDVTEPTTETESPTASGSGPVLPIPANSRGGRWPRRRTLATVLLSPLVLALMVSAGGGWEADAPLWTALTVATSLVGALIIASYLPQAGRGWRPDLGCTPCAAVSAATVLGAAWLLEGAPHQPSMAATALALVAFGLYQRRSGAGTACAL